ncbi:MAG: hypothetical protein R3C59_25155 [Planctomycetaceae bacterium]
MTPEDHTTAIHDAIEAARAVNGIVEFEAGKVYRTKQIKIWKADSTTPETMPAGIEGNGAILKWKKDDTPASSDALIYLQSPQYRGNSGFFIRNLTLDCGNNPIGGLDGSGGTGQSDTGQLACDFGLRILGGEDFLNNVRNAYREIPAHYSYFKGINIGGTVCNTRAAWQTALKDKYNIFLVLHDETSSDQTTDIEDQIAEYTGSTLIDGATKGNGDGFNGILAFEPGKTYLVSDTISVQGLGDGAGAPIGIDGNGATLRGTGTGSTHLLEMIRCHNSNDAQNDRFGFWIRDLTLDSQLKFDSSLYVQDCKFFHVRDVTATGAKDHGVHINAFASGNTDVYYGLFQRLAAVRNGSDGNPANGILAEFGGGGGVRLANVGFADCDMSFNRKMGLQALQSTLTSYRSRIEGNMEKSVYAQKTYSIDLVNCRITVGRVTSTSYPTAGIYPQHAESNTGWCGGLHAVGGEVRSQENREGASVPTGLINYDHAEGYWGLFQSMLHISNHPVVEPITMGTDTLIAVETAGAAPGGAEGSGS